MLSKGLNVDLREYDIKSQINIKENVTGVLNCKLCPLMKNMHYQLKE